VGSAPSVTQVEPSGEAEQWAAHDCIGSLETRALGALISLRLEIISNDCLFLSFILLHLDFFLERNWFSTSDAMERCT
jgi:hypothetical protein